MKLELHISEASSQGSLSRYLRAGGDANDDMATETYEEAGREGGGRHLLATRTRRHHRKKPKHKNTNPWVELEEFVFFIVGAVIFIAFAGITRCRRRRRDGARHRAAKTKAKIEMENAEKSEEVLEKKISKLQAQLTQRRVEKTVATARSQAEDMVVELTEAQHERGRAVYGEAWDEPQDGSVPLKELFSLSEHELRQIKIEAYNRIEAERKTGVPTPRGGGGIASMNPLHSKASRNGYRDAGEGKREYDSLLAQPKVQPEEERFSAMTARTTVTTSRSHKPDSKAIWDDYRFVNPRADRNQAPPGLDVQAPGLIKPRPPSMPPPTTATNPMHVGATGVSSSTASVQAPGLQAPRPPSMPPPPAMRSGAQPHMQAQAVELFGDGRAHTQMQASAVEILEGEQGENHYYAIADKLAKRTPEERAKYWAEADPNGTVKPIFDRVLARRVMKGRTHARGSEGGRSGGGVAMLAGEEGEQHYYQIADMLATKSKKEQLKYWRKADPKGNIKPIFDAVLAKRPSKQSAKEQVPAAGAVGARGVQATSAMVMGAQGQANAVELLEGEAGEQHYYKIADMLLLKSKKEQAQYWKTADPDGSVKPIFDQVLARRVQMLRAAKGGRKGSSRGSGGVEQAKVTLVAESEGVEETKGGYSDENPEPDHDHDHDHDRASFDSLAVQAHKENERRANGFGGLFRPSAPDTKSPPEKRLAPRKSGNGSPFKSPSKYAIAPSPAPLGASEPSSPSPTRPPPASAPPPGAIRPPPPSAPPPGAIRPPPPSAPPPGAIRPPPPSAPLPGAIRPPPPSAPPPGAIRPPGPNSPEQQPPQQATRRLFNPDSDDPQARDSFAEDGQLENVRSQSGSIGPSIATRGAATEPPKPHRKPIFPSPRKKEQVIAPM